MCSLLQSSDAINFCRGKVDMEYLSLQGLAQIQNSVVFDWINHCKRLEKPLTEVVTSEPLNRPWGRQCASCYATLYQGLINLDLMGGVSTGHLLLAPNSKS